MSDERRFGIRCLVSGKWLGRKFRERTEVEAMIATRVYSDFGQEPPPQTYDYTWGDQEQAITACFGSDSFVEKFAPAVEWLGVGHGLKLGEHFEIERFDVPWVGAQ